MAPHLLEVRLCLAEFAEEEVGNARRQVRFDEQVVALHGFRPAQYVGAQLERRWMIGAHALVHPQAEQRRELLRHVADDRAQLLRARPRGLDVRRCVALGGDQRGAERDLHVELGQRPLRPIGQLVLRAERAAQVGGRFHVRVAAQRLAAGVEPELHGAFRNAAGRIVVGDDFWRLGDDPCELRFEHFGNAAMMGDPAALQHRFVGGVLDQRMLEEIAFARSCRWPDR